MMLFERIFALIGALYKYFGTIWTVDVFMVRSRFFVVGSRPHSWAGRPASQPDRSAWAGRLPGRPAGRRPDSGPNRPANAGPPAGGRPAASKQPGEPPRRRTCAPGSPPPFHLITFL